MTTAYKIATPRAASAVSQDGAGKRMESTDGTRWAVSANRKRALGNRMFDVVEVWTLRQRIDGKAVVIHRCVDQQYAARWIAA